MGEPGITGAGRPDGEFRPCAPMTGGGGNVLSQVPVAEGVRRGMAIASDALSISIESQESIECRGRLKIFIGFHMIDDLCVRGTRW
jgi:hypothetical protein